MEPEHEQLASASMKATDNASSNGLSTGFPAPSTDASQIEYEPSTNVLEKEDNHQLSELRDSLESNQLKSLLDLLELDIGELSNSQGQLASSSLNLKLELLLQDRSVQAVIAFQKLADICRHGASLHT